MFVFALAQNEFRAAAADIQEQQRLRRKSEIRRDAAEGPFGFFFAGDDFNLHSRGGFDGGKQFVGVDSVARGAGGDDADGNRV